MTCSVFSKRPADRLDFDADFRRDQCLPTTDSIVSATVSVDADSGVVVDAYEFTTTTNPAIVKVWLVDGTLGKTATVTVFVVTFEGREIEITFRVRIEEKC